MGKLVRRTVDGDSVVAEWSADDADSVRAAAEAMRREVEAGYMAVQGGEGRNEPVRRAAPGRAGRDPHDADGRRLTGVARAAGTALALTVALCLAACGGSGAPGRTTPADRVRAAAARTLARCRPAIGPAPAGR